MKILTRDTGRNNYQVIITGTRKHVVYMVNRLLVTIVYLTKQQDKCFVGYEFYYRFGPGMVIYWFGFVEDIPQGNKDQGILIRTSFPEAQEITLIA